MGEEEGEGMVAPPGVVVKVPLGVLEMILGPEVDAARRHGDTEAVVLRREIVGEGRERSSPVSPSGTSMWAEGEDTITTLTLPDPLHLPPINPVPLIPDPHRPRV